METRSFLDCRTLINNGPCPNLRPESDIVIEQSLDVFRMCSGQMRAGGFGVTGIDLMPLYRTADVMGITLTEDHLICFKYIEIKAVEYMNKEQ